MTMRRILSVGVMASAMAVGMAVSAPAPTAQAEAGGRWYMVNKYNGKCVKGNGVKEKLVLATCKKKDAFHWNNYGSAQYANYSAPTISYAACIADNGRNKPPYLRACNGGKGTKSFALASLKNGAKTPIAGNCGYLQAASKTSLKCGRKPANFNKATWIIKYSLK